MLKQSGAEQASEQVKHQYYQKLVSYYTPKPPVIRNCVKAFFIGGTVCLIGQCLQSLYMRYFDFSPDKAADPTVATLIFFTCLLTGLGVFDKLAQWAGAGTAVLVTGFANAMASAAMEHRKEGIVLGVGGNIFKLAGPIIVIGVVAAFVIGLVRAVIT